MLSFVVRSVTVIGIIAMLSPFPGERRSTDSLSGGSAQRPGAAADLATMAKGAAQAMGAWSALDAESKASLLVLATEAAREPTRYRDTLTKADRVVPWLGSR
jgi:hypothetical protein